MAGPNPEKQLHDKISAAVKGVTPGVCVQAHFKGQKIVDLRVGETFDFYDLASLTKIIFSTSSLMQMHTLKPLDLDAPLTKTLTWAPSKNLTLRNLLSHVSGLEWWMPFYKELPLEKTRREKWQKLQEFLSKTPVNEEVALTGRSVYSDLDLLMIAFFLEKEVPREYPSLATEGDLEKIWSSTAGAFGLTDIRFHVDNKPFYAKTRYAPSEDCPWRKQVLQGEVHDDNCWALGGVSTHAGLFGGVDEVSHWIQIIRRILVTGKKEAGISSETLKRFTERAIPHSRGDWALGFMMPTLPGGSSGSYFAESSVGHTGFTGTSAWFDPKRDLSVVILSNRVHPTRANDGFKTLRPEIHNWIIELFEL